MTNRWLILALALAGAARADNFDEAREHYQKGLSAYALSHYGEAADEYERAFALKADSALLYNAAQAHRLAGNQERALQLYRNYLTVFGRRAAKSVEVERHISELKAAIEAQSHAQHSPPTDLAAPARSAAPRSEPLPAEQTPPPQPAPPPREATPLVQQAVIAVTAPPPPPAARPVYKRGWFWGTVVAGVAVVALGVGLGVGLGSRTEAPTPSMGVAAVQ